MSQDPLIPQNTSAIARSDHYRLLFEHAHDLILFVRLTDGQILDANRAAELAYGYNREELLGLQITHLRASSTHNVIPSQLQQAYTTGILFETLHRRKDGSIFPVEVSSLGATIQGEHVNLSIIRDISERKSASRLLEKVFASLAEVVLVQDPTTQLIVQCSAASERVLGYLPDELVGKTTECLYPSNDIYHEFRQRIINNLNPDEVFYVEQRMRRKDGREIFVNLSVSEIQDERGERIAFVTSVQDITQRKEAEVALAESEKRYRSLIELSSACIAVHCDGRLVFINSAGVRLMKAESQEQIIGIQVMDLLLPEARAKNMDILSRLAQGQSVPPVEEKIICLDGTIVDVEIIGNMILFEGKQAFQLIVQDITERKRVEDALRDSEAKFRTIIEQNSEGVVLVDEQGQIIEWNQANERITGLPRQEVLGQSIWELLFQLIPLNRRTSGLYETIKANAAAALKTGQSPMFYAPYETVIQRLDGELIFVQQLAFPIKTNSGYRIGSLIRNITGQKQTEAVINERNKALRERERQLDQIIQQMPFPVEINKPDGTALAVNRAFLDMYGIPSADLVVGKFNVFTDPSMIHSGLLERVRPAYQGKTVFLQEVESDFHKMDPVYQAKGDGKRYDDITVFPVLHETGEVWQVVTIWKDATERRAAEWELEHRLVELEALHAVAQAGTESANLNELVARVVHILSERFDTKDIGIGFYDGELRTLIFHPAARNCIRSINPSVSIDQGIAGWVARHQTSIRVADVHNDPNYLESNTYTQSELCVPILIQGELIGVINVESPHLNAFQEASERLLVAVAEEMSTAIEKIRLLEAERDRRKELEVLTEISAVARVAETQESMHPIILERMMTILSAQGAAIAFRDSRDQDLVFELGWGDWEAIQGIRVPPGSGIGGYVADTKEILVIEDARNDTRMFRKDFIGSVNSLICLPLMVEEVTVAVLYVGREPAFQPSDVHLAQAMGDIVASAIHRVKLYRKTEQQLERLTALREIDHEILSIQNQDATLEIVLEKILGQLRVDAGNIVLYDARTQLLQLSTACGVSITHPKGMKLYIEDSLAGRAIKKQEIEFIPNLQLRQNDLSPDILAFLSPFTSYLAVPLVAKGEVKGILQLFHRTQLDPAPDWMDFLQVLANQAAIAIDNAQLFVKQQQANQHLLDAYDNTIDGWSRALDLRDKETDGHSQRVTELTLRLSKFFSIPTESLQHIRRGALLHDIGKMGIPDNILLKAGPLSDTEWEIMRKHPLYALDLLYRIDFLQPALEIPFCHHEKWDGSGYPQRLKGEQIPLSARIFAIVDVWDALTSDRPYRQAWSKKKACDHIRDQSGKHFDPKVVEAFLNLFDQENQNLILSTTF